MNTLGQDREFTDEERKFALRTVRDYKETWERVEKENLHQDVLRRIENIQTDKEYKENHEALDAQALEKQIDEALIAKEGEEPLDEEAKHYAARKLRFQILTKGFYSPPVPPAHHQQPAPAKHK